MHSFDTRISFVVFLTILAAVCSLPCENGGICTAPDTCRCAPGSTGNHCEIRTLKLYIVYKLVSSHYIAVSELVQSMLYEGVYFVPCLKHVKTSCF